MEAKIKHYLQDCADFLQENRTQFVAFLSVRGYDAPHDRADEIVDCLSGLPRKLFAAKKRLRVLFSRIEQQNFRTEDCYLSEFSAYLELKDIIDLM